MNRTKSIITMHWQNKVAWIIVPWLIMMASFLVNLFIGILTSGKVPIYTGGILSIYIYMLVTGIVILNNTFPLALGWSVRRTDYYWGTVIVALATSVVMAIGLVLFSFIESMTAGWGVNLHFFKLPYFNDAPLIGQLWIFIVLLLFAFSIGFVIGSVYQCYRAKGVWSITGILALFGTIFSALATYYNWWWTIISSIGQHTVFELSFWFAAFVVILGAFSYLFLRRANVA